MTMSLDCAHCRRTDSRNRQSDVALEGDGSWRSLCELTAGPSGGRCRGSRAGRGAGSGHRSGGGGSVSAGKGPARSARPSRAAPGVSQQAAGSVGGEQVALAAQWSTGRAMRPPIGGTRHQSPPDFENRQKFESKFRTVDNRN